MISWFTQVDNKVSFWGRLFNASRRLMRNLLSLSGQLRIAFVSNRTVIVSPPRHLYPNAPFCRKPLESLVLRKIVSPPPGPPPTTVGNELTEISGTTHDP